jgi:DNA-binding NarL/FixJ family response regulator
MVQEIEGRPPNRLLLFTTEPLLGNGIRALLDNVPMIELAGICDHAANLSPEITARHPDLVVLDVNPEASFELLAEIQFAARNCRILLLAPPIDAAMCYRLQLAGVAGIILRNCPMEEFVAQIIEALYYYTGWMGKADHLIESQVIHLSRRERELISLVGRGMKNKEIADQLVISEYTVKAYLSKLFRKLGVKSRLEMALYGMRLEPDREAASITVPYTEPAVELAAPGM